ncbi:MAG: O-antigen ligase family protein [Acidobacteria bacterium]|nr:O-antigen ligase family protein [Acidobacteriota bacterium]
MAASTATLGLPTRDRLADGCMIALAACAGATQVSIAAAEILLALALIGWLVMVAVRRERIDTPRFFVPLTAYAGATLVSAAFSPDPARSLLDAKEVLLFLVVPMVMRIARGECAGRIHTVILTVGAIAAILGIVQYGILHYDNLGKRPQGTLTHYMTYSGVIMLVIGVAVARVLYRQRDRAWASLVLPAVVVALALTFTRSAWVGACLGVAVLFMLKDRRLFAITPVLAALFIAVAPARVTDRVYSMFDLKDPSNRDRLAMMQAGTAMVKDHPLTGVGPDMVTVRYPQYRVASAVNEHAPHLHNVPMQIAAERGLPALALWCWFIAVTAWDLVRRMRTSADPSIAAAGLAALVSMCAAGMFEYNFGDSEFLILLLVLVTLPFAADHPAPERTA